MNPSDIPLTLVLLPRSDTIETEQLKKSGKGGSSSKAKVVTLGDYKSPEQIREQAVYNKLYNVCRECYEYNPPKNITTLQDLAPTTAEEAQSMLDQALDHLQSRVDNIDKTHEELSKDFKQIDRGQKRIAIDQKSIDNAQKRIAIDQKRIDSEQQELREDYAKISTQLDLLETKFRDSKKEDLALTQKFKELEGKFKAFEELISTCEKGIEESRKGSEKSRAVIQEYGRNKLALEQELRSEQQALISSQDIRRGIRAIHLASFLSAIYIATCWMLRNSALRLGVQNTNPRRLRNRLFWIMALTATIGISVLLKSRSR